MSEIDYISKYSSQFLDFLAVFVPKVILASVLLWLGIKVIGKLNKIAEKSLYATSLSRELSSFLHSLADVGMKLVLFFVIAGVFGINTASFVAVLAAAGFAVGMALQGSLSNFAAGIVILLFKPFKVDDWVGSDTLFGKVIEIQMFSTQLQSPGKKMLIIPNSQLIGGAVTNYSTYNVIRLELTVYMPYNEDFPKVRALILDVLHKIPQVLNDPAPEVGIGSFDTHSIVLNVRPYTHPDQYWEAYYQTYEDIKKVFHQEGIKVAYSEGVELGDIGR